ncbi:MAG: gamma-glutamylcyclotransferase [Pseudomonadota bacterium]
MSHWVFAYASLIWKQDFPVIESHRARLRGWQRRLWQGSHDHRGTPDAPGRVVTLVPAADAVCDGLALRIDDSVFEHLDYREKNGYVRRRLTLTLDGGTDEGSDEGTLDATAYVGDAGNFAWLGAAPLDEIATQVAVSSGPSGSNREYVLELDRALARFGVVDDHIRAVADRLRRLEPGACDA